MKLSRIVGTFLIILFLAVAPALVFAQDGSTVDVTGGIIGVVFSSIFGALAALGVATGIVRQRLRRVHAELVDFDEIDRAVEKMLKFLPDVIADYIGDAVAQLATNVHRFGEEPTMDVLRDIFIDEISRRSAVAVTEMTGGAASTKTLANREARSALASKIASSPLFEEIAHEKAKKARISIKA